MSGTKSCCVCEAELTTGYERVEDPQSGEAFALLLCPCCGLGVTEPPPEDAARYYGASYWGKRHGITARFRCWRRLRLIQRYLRPGGRLLDVGCGEGELLAAAARRGFSVAGTELAPLAEHAGGGIEMYGSLNEIDPNTSFDVVTLWHSLEHLGKPEREIDRIASLLPDGGVLMLAVPDFGGAQSRAFGRIWFHLDVPRHLFHFTRRALLEMLTRRGLIVERVHYHEFEYDLFGWLQSTLNALLPTPNLFYGWITRKPTHGSTLEVVASIVLAVLLTPFAIVATALGSLFRRGGTLRVIARKQSAAAHGAADPAAA